MAEEGGHEDSSLINAKKTKVIKYLNDYVKGDPKKPFKIESLIESLNRADLNTVDQLDRLIEIFEGIEREANLDVNNYNINGHGAQYINLTLSGEEHTDQNWNARREVRNRQKTKAVFAPDENFFAFDQATKLKKVVEALEKLKKASIIAKKFNSKNIGLSEKFTAQMILEIFSSEQIEALYTNFDELIEKSKGGTYAYLTLDNRSKDDLPKDYLKRLKSRVFPDDTNTYDHIRSDTSRYSQDPKAVAKTKTERLESRVFPDDMNTFDHFQGNTSRYSQDPKAVAKTKTDRSDYVLPVLGFLIGILFLAAGSLILATTPGIPLLLFAIVLVAAAVILLAGFFIFCFKEKTKRSASVYNTNYDVPLMSNPPSVNPTMVNGASYNIAQSAHIPHSPSASNSVKAKFSSVSMVHDPVECHQVLVRDGGNEYLVPFEPNKNTGQAAQARVKRNLKAKKPEANDARGPEYRGRR